MDKYHPIDLKMRDRHFRLFGHVYSRAISALMKKKWIDSSWENKKRESNKIILIELRKNKTCQLRK